jgi:acyl-CoA synthetase
VPDRWSLAPSDAHDADTIDHYRRVGAWRDDSSAAFVDRWADARATDVFLYDADRRLTWGEVRGLSWRTAASLRRLGVGHGDRVAVQLPNWYEFVVVYLALARIGAVLVPAMPIYRRHELHHMLRHHRGDRVCVPGHIVFSSPSMMLGYWRNPTPAGSRR